MEPSPAPEIEATEWLNSAPLALAGLRGKVVVIEAFQMLCPGCVQHGIPQAQRIAAAFRGSDVQVIGLHSVFEHHAVQGTRAALEVFLHEFRVAFPVAIDRQDGRLPATMAAYGMQGTPTLVLVDRAGRRRAQYLGAVSDLELGAGLGQLIAETAGWPARG
jgi:hypothetical protein